MVITKIEWKKVNLENHFLGKVSRDIWKKPLYILGCTLDWNWLYSSFSENVLSWKADKLDLKWVVFPSIFHTLLFGISFPFSSPFSESYFLQRIFNVYFPFLSTDATVIEIFLDLIFLLALFSFFLFLNLFFLRKGFILENSIFSFVVVNFFPMFLVNISFEPQKKTYFRIYWQIWFS